MKLFSYFKDITKLDILHIPLKLSLSIPIILLKLPFTQSILPHTHSRCLAYILKLPLFCEFDFH